MAGNRETKKHVVCVPYPAQGHITPMLKLAKLLNSKGFYITFVNTEHNHRRLMRSRGPRSVDGTRTFRFEAIPDGLASVDADVSQDVPSLMNSLANNCLDPFMNLLLKLNTSCSGSPPVTVIISDSSIPFAFDAARQLGGLPVVLFWPAGAFGFLGCAQFGALLDKGIVPFKDHSFMTYGSLDMVVDWLPSMKGIRLKDLPSFIRITDKYDVIFRNVMRYVDWSCESPIIFNTFETLEHEALKEISTMAAGPIYTIGPLHCQLDHLLEDKDEVNSLGSNLWKEDPQCLKWLDSRKPKSVVYVSFGSFTTMTNEQLVEFAWGLANCNHPVLWIIRPDIIASASDCTGIIPFEFLNEVKDRSLLASWCDQESVLKHPSIGVFLTHCGWNSTLDSISGGVPVICWPFFADQQTNCWCCCNKWGIGMEMNGDVKRDEIEKQIREVMEGEKGKEMKKKAMEWKNLAEEATSSPNGSSFLKLDQLLNHLSSL